MKKILAASLMMAFVLTGCNTVKGMGKDVSKAGNAVTNTAEKTSDEIRQNQFFPDRSQNPILDRVFFISFIHIQAHIRLSQGRENYRLLKTA